MHHHQRFSPRNTTVGPQLLEIVTQIILGLVAVAVVNMVVVVAVDLAIKEVVANLVVTTKTI